MAYDLHACLTFNYKQILIEEIALDGLSGIALDLLWLRVEKRISAAVTEKMKARFWGFLVNCKPITFYQLTVPLQPCTEILDRFMITDEYSGHLMDPPVYLDGEYEYRPVANEHGSCSNYDARKEIKKQKLSELGSYENVLAEYGSTLVMVASLDERWKALAPHMPASVISQLSPIHYCILELVGKSRHNGQMTIGKTNITKIVKEPKFLFYNRNYLQKLDMIRVLCVTIKQDGKGIKGLLLRLKRFHKPTILSMPKVGKLHNVKEYLLEQPNYCEKTDVVITKGLINQHNIRRLQKTINVFSFDEKVVESESRNKKGSKMSVAVKRRFISLNTNSDESSQSEDEDNEIIRKCQYKVGVDLLRQAYELFLEAGLKGLTQIEIAQLLGVEFYTSRTICRVFKVRHIIREYLEDKGKQRTARYFATAAASGEINQKYEEEKKKLLEYINNSKSEEQPQPIAEEDDDVPLKKIKLDKESKAIEVTEIKVLDGLENFNSESLLFSKKNPTLRQLRFANGLLKITRERLAISGYQTLSVLVSKETGEPPMDTKALKIFVQKLVTDGQLKLMKIKWPGFHQKYSILICSPYVNCTDPIVKAKQREISIRAFTNKKVKRERNLDLVHRPPSQYAYPRYMKIQLLHEFLAKLIYFDENKVKIEFNLPNGFASLVNIIPEITVQFAIGNISNMAVSDLAHLKIDQDVLDLKLRDAPEELYHMLLQSKSLQTSIRINLKVLAMLGLIQLVNQPTAQTTDHNSSLSSYVFYVNKKAKIIDTTGTWPRKNTKTKHLEKTFHFESFDDVKRYWNEVYEVSTHTTIEYPHRGQKKLVPPVRQMHEVEECDNGERYGDGAGPCGFDSCFYMEQSRFWRAFYIRVIKNKPIKKIPRKRKHVPEKKPKKTKLKKLKVKPPPESVPVPKIPQKKLPFKGYSTIKWSHWEDTILMMCKVAITIMSPISQPGCLKIRNNTAKDLLAIFDPYKIGSACHRRAEALDLDLALQHEKECLINALRKRRDLILKYEGLLRKLKARHAANMTKFIHEARIPMLELVWLINQLVENRSKEPAVPCVAVDMDDFHNRYTVTTTTANKPCNSYKGDGDTELSIAKVKETIIMCVMTSLFSTPAAADAMKTFSTLAEFDEHTLRTGLEQLRKCGAVACKDKVLHYHLHRFNIQDTVKTSYKLSAAYQRRWINRLNTNFTDQLADMMKTDVSQTSIKASPEINCLLCESQACGLLEIISVTVPVITGSSGSIIQEQQLNVIDIDMKFKLKSGILGYKKITDFKTFTEHFDNIEPEDIYTTLQKISLATTVTCPNNLQS
ncbi:hypothetical protein MSG28_008580 [Choristoneura fumiferana]|uniref:Uncharacterized protein n=1 Tax=Choristoneura fumiferana TaxID=7141 RepID=A0ACC0J794_CHOFU|nr:hypothetical protein MSG28_008580 [Choristoneura fumiferana]